MQNKRLLMGLSLTAALISFNAYSFDMKGTITSTAARTAPAPHSQYNALTAPGAKAAMPSVKQVVLMKVNLTNKEKQKFTSFQPTKTLSEDKPGLLPEKVDLGMNNVPVLDQGQHGTCVTFATSAAIDSVLRKGDYVSQLCSLELGEYLADHGYRPAGWEGSFGPMVLDQMLAFGVVNKQAQKEGKCVRKDYPLTNPDDTGVKIPLESFKPISEGLDEKLYWEPVLTATQRIFDSYDHSYDAEKVFMDVKKALANKLEARQTRMTFGVLLPVQHCMAGACARYHATNDTWALTSSINNDVLPMLGGHEMVITGYDDNATALDNEGGVHKGLFTLRNSWGEDVGDKGNFYMTYDFFKKFAFEVQKVVAIEEGSDS